MANYNDILNALKENYSSPNGEDIYLIDLPGNDPNAIEKVILLTSVSPDKPRYYEGQQYENGVLVSDKQISFAEPPDMIADRIAGEEDDFHVKLIIAYSNKNIRNMIPIFSDPDVVFEENIGRTLVDMTGDQRLEANFAYYVLQSRARFSEKFQNGESIQYFLKHGCRLQYEMSKEEATFESLVIEKVLEDNEFEQSDLPLLRECYEKALDLEVVGYKLVDGRIVNQSEMYEDMFLFIGGYGEDPCSHFWKIPFQGYNLTMIGSTKEWPSWL